MVETKQQYPMLSQDWPQIPGGITALSNLLDGCGRCSMAWAMQPNALQSCLHDPLAGDAAAMTTSGRVGTQPGPAVGQPQ